MNDDFEESPRTPATQRSINQRPGDSSGPGLYSHSTLKKLLHLQVLWHPPTYHPPCGGLEEKAGQGELGSTCRRTQYRCTAKEIQILTRIPLSLKPKTNIWTFQTVTEGAPVQVRKYQIERRIFQVGARILKSEKAEKRFCLGAAGIEAASNPGAKGKWGGDCEAVGREVQWNHEKPRKSG